MTDPIEEAAATVDNIVEARAKCVDAANMIVAKHVPGGFWRWLDSDHLRVYKAGGEPLLTLKIEAMQ